MAQLIVRDLDDEVKEQLRQRAKRHGRSMEAEVRSILQNAVREETPPVKGLGTRISERFAGLGLEPEDIRPLRGWSIQTPDFDQ